MGSEQLNRDSIYTRFDCAFLKPSHDHESGHFTTNQLIRGYNYDKKFWQVYQDSNLMRNLVNTLNLNLGLYTMYSKL